MQLSKCISTPNSDSQIHLLESFSICTLWSESSLEVLNESNCFIALSDNAVQFVLSQQARNFVDIDANVVERGCFSSDAQGSFIKLKRLYEVFLLQEFVGLVLVLGESDLVKLFLNDFEHLRGLLVLRLEQKNLVKISFGLFIVFESVVRLGSSQENLAFERILFAERFGL